MAKFKVGDEVKILWDSTGYAYSGYKGIGIIGKIECNGSWITVDSFDSDTSYSLGFRPRNLELIKSASGETISRSKKTMKLKVKDQKSEEEVLEFCLEESVDQQCIYLKAGAYTLCEISVKGGLYRYGIARKLGLPADSMGKIKLHSCLT